MLSGYRGNSIYYEKVMFSCGGSLVNIFAITYPVEQRDVYDPIGERMENIFRPGRCYSEDALQRSTAFPLCTRGVCGEGMNDGTNEIALEKASNTLFAALERQDTF